ncbi:MAG: acyl-ACP thioesterase [Cyclobacteriaceae bacterium]
MNDSVYFDSFRLKATETDASKRIKIPYLVNYMQEAAWTNATKLGFSTYDLLNDNMTWVVNRMYVEFIELPSYPQLIDVETWPSDLDKFFAYRDFRVFDKNKKLLARATSNWLVLDIEQRKLISIPQHFIDAGFTAERNAMPRVSDKYSYDEARTENTFKTAISWFDLDVNAHVNNIKYFQWILDSLGSKVLEKLTCKTLDITFKSEAGADDKIISQSYSTGENSFAHRIISETTGKVLVLARTTFK